MPDFVNLTCPSCGGALQVTQEIERFACGYCGREHVVRRTGGLISLSPVIEEIKGVRVATDRTASELALVRLNGELLELQGRLPALWERTTKYEIVWRRIRRYFRLENDQRLPEIGILSVEEINGLLNYLKSVRPDHCSSWRNAWMDTSDLIDKAISAVEEIAVIKRTVNRTLAEILHHQQIVKI